MIRAEPRFAELATMTNFSFLRGASHPEELVAQAAALGLTASASPTAIRSPGWCARMCSRVRKPHRPAPCARHGARLVFNDGTPDILAYPRIAPLMAVSAAC